MLKKGRCCTFCVSSVLYCVLYCVNSVLYVCCLQLSIYLSIYLSSIYLLSISIYLSIYLSILECQISIAADKHWSKKDYLLLTLCLPSGSLLIIFFTAFLWSWVALFRRFCCRLGFEELLSIYVSIYLSQRSI